MDAYLGSLSSFALAYTCNSARHALYNCYDKERYRLDMESHAALIVLLTMNVSVYEGVGRKQPVGWLCVANVYRADRSVGPNLLLLTAISPTQILQHISL